MRLDYPYPVLDGPSQDGIVDPDEVNANFYAIARLINGNLGVENLIGARKITAAMLQKPRSLHCVSICLDTSLGTWPDGTGPATVNGQIFRMPYAGNLVAVGVYRATTTFNATLRIAGAVKAQITDLSVPGASDGRVSFLVTDIENPAFAANDIYQLTLVTGNVRGITLWFTTAHTTHGTTSETT